MVRICLAVSAAGKSHAVRAQPAPHKRFVDGDTLVHLLLGWPPEGSALRNADMHIAHAKMFRTLVTEFKMPGEWILFNTEPRLLDSFVPVSAVVCPPDHKLRDNVRSRTAAQLAGISGHKTRLDVEKQIMANARLLEWARFERVPVYSAFDELPSS